MLTAVMSASPSIDAYDAQMLDFPSDQDVPMNIQVSADFFSEALMDHDSHHLPPSAYAEHASVEVDMEEYVGDNAEYEMVDETADYQRPPGDDLLDVEVYDASHVPSPVVPPQPLQPSSDVPIESVHASPVFSDSAHSHLPAEPESEAHHAHLDHPATDIPHEEPTAPAVVFSADVEKEAPVAELTHPVEPSGENQPPTSEPSEQPEDAVHVSGQPLHTPAPADADAEFSSHVHTSAEEHTSSSEVAQHEHNQPDPPTSESTPLVGTEDPYDSDPPIPEEKATDQVPPAEGETVDPHQNSEGVYSEPPPAILLSIADSFESEFSLFNQPRLEPESYDVSHGKQNAYSLLLESRPALYYESLSNVFEALRQDEELLFRIPHSFEGELVLDAYDLQLVASEDNVHSRDISLHDLNILHDGSDFAGPLRLHLRSVIPRFIIRYYALQEQVQRLNLAVETGEGEPYEEQHEHYDTTEELQHPQEAEEFTHPSTDAAAEPLGVPTSTSVEEPLEESELPVPGEEPREEEAPTVVQEPAAEYHEVTGEATHALEDEDDYEGTNTGDEDESTKSEILDADEIHEVAAEDTDAPATVTGQEPEFGGEQTEYLDYVQPEEYDERYGEELPEKAGGASPVQYGEPQHYEEAGEQDTSTAVDETQAVLPASEEEEEQEESSATPVPAHAILEPEPSESVLEEATHELLAAAQEEAATAQDHESTTEATHDTEGKQETSKTNVDVFREADESDSNFVALLEREANAEFDREFDPNQGGQEGSVEDVLKHDETWEEWDDEDAEGEDEEDWVDPDVASNDSSVTLSSKASSKRGHDEVEPGEEEYAEHLENSPGSKRPRVQ